MQAEAKTLGVLTILATIFTLLSYGISPERTLWTDPGDPSSFDLRYGIGGEDHQPQPPFHFVSEDMSGTTPKIGVTDARGMTWNVKWGEEVGPSTFCTRLIWACGYFANTEYFVASGNIEGAHGLKRARGHVSRDGSFVNARFQLRTDSPKYLEEQGWLWTQNPFVGTPELQGLKILMMLVSNWDGKDARDFVSASNGGMAMDSNLDIFLDESTGKSRYLYADDDWGASLGKWGNFFGRSKWDCKGFTEQTSDFVRLSENGSLKWGYDGKHRKDIANDIRPSDVQWLLRYLGKITDEQIRTGLAASGATPAQTECFTQTLRRRIELLQGVAVEGLHTTGLTEK